MSNRTRTGTERAVPLDAQHTRRGRLLYRHVAGSVQAVRLLRDGLTIDDFERDFPTDTKDQAECAIKRIDNEYVRRIKREYAREHHRAADAAAEDGGRGRGTSESIDQTSTVCSDRHRGGGSGSGGLGGALWRVWRAGVSIDESRKRGIRAKNPSGQQGKRSLSRQLEG